MEIFKFKKINVKTENVSKKIIFLKVVIWTESIFYQTMEEIIIFNMMYSIPKIDKYFWRYINFAERIANRYSLSLRLSYAIRPPLNEKTFPVDRPSGYKRAD